MCSKLEIRKAKSEKRHPLQADDHGTGNGRQGTGWVEKGFVEQGELKRLGAPLHLEGDQHWILHQASQAYSNYGSRERLRVR